MKTSRAVKKDKLVRALAGISLIIVLVVQKYYQIDLTIIIFCIGLNLFQYGFTGWCPISHYFSKIGWLQNQKLL